MNTHLSRAKTSLRTSIWSKCIKWMGLAAIAGHGLVAGAVNLTPLPPYLAETKGAPMVMLNMSKDHQLFYKAYNEFSDLDGDGVADTQYKHTYRYYGYFDNRRCYSYSTTNNRFVPTRKENASTAANPTLCGGGTDNDASAEWHGNFLNWATMTRMDVVRRILYGGLRSTDDSIVSGASLTVLERAHLPTDAHAFAKYYNSAATGGVNIRMITPFTGQTEITICNASFQKNATWNNTPARSRYSHGTDIGPPSMLVASGNHALWNSNERWQCYWREDQALLGNNPLAGNGNIAAKSGINASSESPSRATLGLGTGIAIGSYTVRVETCKTGLDSATSPATGFTDDEEAKCKFYPLGNYKPAGLLQKYGERNEAAFGLMTGSFAKNTSGGVLRKNIATFTDEVDLDDGQFKSVDGIVKTLNKLRIYGYDYNNGTYKITGDDCDYQLVGLTDNLCVSWGNPMGEMYLESLRYLAGKTASSNFTYADSGSKDNALGLSIATWSDPFAAGTVTNFGDQLCRRSSIVNFNASVTSYDNNQWSEQSDIAGMTGTRTAEALTDNIGTAEGLYATDKKWAIGSTANNTNEMCNAKDFTALSTSKGICPEAPTASGGFLMAGAALHAHTTPIRSDFTIPTNNKRAFKVDTYGVALATGTPIIKVPVPGVPGKFVIIQPAYRLVHNTRGQGGGALVDFRVVTQTDTAGKFAIQWEDSEQGGDYDQDVWGTLEYSVDTVTKIISISTLVIDEATNQKQGFGYVISGTGNSKDGVHFHSGIEDFEYTDPTNITIVKRDNVSVVIAANDTIINTSGGCKKCNKGDAKTTVDYTMVGVGGEVLRDPLWYAAKYGGFDRDKYTTDYVPGAVLTTDSWDSKKTDGSAGSDGIPDNFFYSIDPNQLEKSLEQIFSTILKAGGAAPAAATSSRTAAGGYVYVSTHSIKAASAGVSDADASGEFLRFGFQANGSIAGTADWDAGAKLTTQVENTGWNASRRVFTLSNTAAVPFRWTDLSDSQKTALATNPASASPGALDTDPTDGSPTYTTAKKRLNWLRGSATDETTAGGLRKRTKTKLGAIINSTPWYVGPPSAGYTNVDYGGGYGTFKSTNAARNSVFVGANDGMLHGFNADTGLEQFAYVPRAMYSTSTTAPYSKLAAITAKDYSLNTGTERMNVDGSVMAADINLGTSSPDWHTYLFGAFGRGARGVYALDVTSPQTITSETTVDAAAIVKWEFTEAADSDMGYITGRTNARSNGQPTQSGYMANDKWAAIYGNGYNSQSGHAALFIVFANGPASASSTTWVAGTDYVKLSTGAAGQGPNNGLATPYAVDSNNDGKIDVIYAGDLKGNVWKFDVSSTTVSNWGVATQTSAADTTKVPLFIATTGVSNTLQPITTTVIPFAHPQGGYQIFFGTGKALESNDYPMSSVYSHTLYGLYDKYGSNTPITTGKTDLVQQTSITSSGYRYMTQNPVSYPTKKGWYMDLPVASEGVIFNPLAEDSLRVNVRSTAPEATSDGCRYDATTFDASLNPLTGIPVSNLFPTAPLVNGYSAAGSPSLNSFEFSKGGVYKVPPPTPSLVACTAGTANCTCNTAAPSQCVVCENLATCNPPWDDGTFACISGQPSCACNPAAPATCVVCTNPATCKLPWSSRSSNQCMYRTLSALGSGGVAASERFGACTDGRLTWREILRNR